MLADAVIMVSLKEIKRDISVKQLLTNYKEKQIITLDSDTNHSQASKYDVSIT